MSKRESSEEPCAGANKRPALQRKQHLYLVLPDWDQGYSILKLDVDAFDTADDTELPANRFTEPPVVARIDVAHHKVQNFVSHDTKIFAMPHEEASPAIPAFDTHTLGLSLCPCIDGNYGEPLFVSAAGKLFAFMDDLTALYLAGDPPPHDGNSAAAWSWTSMDWPPPFYASHVTCYALHPDGRTLFVSADASRHRNRGRGRDMSGTFSLDTESMQWKRHGDWLLPFAGQAYFDIELKAWVGLCDEPDEAGHLCSCDVEPVAAQFMRPPSWKLGEDKLLRNEPERHLGAKLVYMVNSRFCLVEFMFHKDDEHLLRRDPKEAGRRRVLHVTAFGLKYSEEGQLRTTLRRARSCKTYSKQPPDYGYGMSVEPVAFWL